MGRWGHGARGGALGMAVLVALGAAPSGARAETDPQVLERVQALEQELAILKRQIEVKDEAAAAALPTTPIAGAGPDGFFLKSRDNFYQIRFRGYTQFDGRFFSQGDPTTNDTFAFRRIRPVLEGTVGEVVDFKIMPDFAGNALNLFDAYVNVHYWPELQFQAGKFKPPVGLERLQSATSLMFVERGAPTLLVPNRDLGVMFQGDVRSGLLTYQVGLFNGSRDNVSSDNGDLDTDDGKDVAARIFAQPFKETAWTPVQGLGLGIAGTWGDVDSTLASFRTIGGQTFFTYANGVRGEGKRWRVSPQANYYWGPFGLLAEYVWNTQEVVRNTGSGRTARRRDLSATNTAWQVAASYVLTGENASFRGVVPRTSFDPRKNTWGAFELAARYGIISFDGDLFENGGLFADPSVSVRTAQQWTVGLNWYMNRWLKFVVNYDNIWFNGGGPRGSDRDTETAVLTRLQLNF
jgi:phosphate-selective porin OprO/OprP